jgi:hypothetical protein
MSVDTTEGQLAREGGIAPHWWALVASGLKSHTTSALPK